MKPELPGEQPIPSGMPFARRHVSVVVSGSSSQGTVDAEAIEECILDGHHGPGPWNVGDAWVPNAGRYLIKHVRDR